MQEGRGDGPKGGTRRYVQRHDVAGAPAAAGAKRLTLARGGAVESGAGRDEVEPWHWWHLPRGKDRGLHAHDHLAQEARGAGQAVGPPAAHVGVETQLGQPVLVDSPCDLLGERRLRARGTGARAKAAGEPTNGKQRQGVTLFAWR